jgi:CDP-diacylglycerol pyrophosphatase
VSWKIVPVVLAVCALVAGAAAVRVIASARTDPDALWKVVHGLCARDETANRIPAPCLTVNLTAGYAVLKDARGNDQVLVIPTARVSGIESPEVTQPGAPNYFEEAWAARRYVERLAGQTIPREDIALAVNSIDGRSQNQLHIHVDCVRPSVKQTLGAALPRIGPGWSRFRLTLMGQRYRARWIAGEDLGGRNPFALLAEDPAARARMGRETLAVVGAVKDGEPGFVLLSDHADLAHGDEGHAESLTDARCRILAAPPPSSVAVVTP